MISVSTAWCKAQLLQLRPESDVKIEFYSAVTGSSIVTINKANISTFNYKVSGKVENVNTPSFNINLELIKGTYDEIKRGYYAKLFFGMYINNAWEYREINWFRVTEVSIPANGLVDKYVLKAISDEELSRQYTKGSNGGDLDALKFFSKVYGYTVRSAQADLAEYNDLLIGMSLGNCSKFEALQVLAMACGKTLIVDKIATMILLEQEYLVPASDVRFKSIAPDNTDTIYNYVISPANSYSFPELKNSNQISNLVVTVYTNTKIDDPVAHTYNQVFTEFIIMDSWTKQFDELYYSIATSVKAGTFLYMSKSLNGYTASWSAIKNTNIARVEVYLYTMKTTAEQKTYVINSSGEDFYVDDELINNNYLSYASDYLSAWLPFQDYIECDFRIDPRLELFDKIMIFDKSNNGHIVIVEEINIEFNGSFNGKIRGRNLLTFDASTVLPVVIEDYGDDEFDTVHISNPNNFMVDITICLSTGAKQNYTIAPNNSITVWADSDNRPMQNEKYRMMSNTLTTDTYIETKIYGVPSSPVSEKTVIYYALKQPVITANAYDSSGNFSVTIQNQNNIEVELVVKYSGGTRTFTIQANSSLTLDNNNASFLADSAMEKAYQDLFDTVDCAFTHLYPFDPEYGDGYTQYTYYTIIWEADN